MKEIYKSGEYTIREECATGEHTPDTTKTLTIETEEYEFEFSFAFGKLVNFVRCKK